MVQIKNRYTGKVICEGETVRAAVIANVKCLYDADLRGVDLRDTNLRDANLYAADLRDTNLYGANLRGANLRDADLRGADLYGADLYGADLYAANLRGADVRGADLHGTNLRGVDLRGAYLYAADLRGAYLRGANLRGADLHGAQITFQSHDLLAEILRRAAGNDIAKLKVAGLILVSRDKCWNEFLGMAAHEPLADWALDELAKWVQPDDGAPEVLRQRAAANEAVLGGAK